MRFLAEKFDSLIFKNRFFEGHNNDEINNSKKSLSVIPDTGRILLDLNDRAILEKLQNIQTSVNE